nr:hypothetical protein [Tanacetum cinerariifolium]
MLLAKKDKDEQVLLAEDQAWMESSSDSDQEINANMVFMARLEKVLSDSEASSSSADEKISEVSYYLSESESESKYETLEYYDNTTNYAIDFLEGTSVVVVILVKGHVFPTIVKIRPVEGCDPLALVDDFTPVEDNACFLETRFDEEALFVIVFLEGVMGSANLTLLSLFFWVTATNFFLELLKLRQVCSIIISNS